MSTGRNTAVRDRDRATIRRTGAACGICEQPIDYALTVVEGRHGKRCKGGPCAGCVPHPMRFEVDHIVPLIRGGTDTIDNKQASHRACNRTKSDKLEGDVTEAPRTFVTSRSW